MAIAGSPGAEAVEASAGAGGEVSDEDIEGGVMGVASWAWAAWAAA
jgi:hypothetical protein